MCLGGLPGERITFGSTKVTSLASAGRQTLSLQHISRLFALPLHKHLHLVPLALYCLRLSPWRRKDRTPLSATFLSSLLAPTHHSLPLPTNSPKDKTTIIHPFTIQALTKCSSRNLFVLKTIHFHGGGMGVLQFLDVQTFRRAPELSRLFSDSYALHCTFLHLQKTQLFCFRAIPHSATKNTRAWVRRCRANWPSRLGETDFRGSWERTRFRIAAGGFRRGRR